MSIATSADTGTAFRLWSLPNPGGQIPNPRLNPSFKIKGVAVVLHPLEIVSVANEQLGQSVGSLTGQRDAIAAALDEVFTRAFG